MSGEWRVTLGWPAQVDLGHMRWDDERELGGCLFGRIDHARHRIYVERAHANPSGPHERTWTKPTKEDTAYFTELEDFDRGLKYPLKSHPGPEFRIVGHFHSHPARRGPARASGSDFKAWRTGAAGFAHPYVGIVATPGSERWLGGYPDGPDWDDLVLSTWVTEPSGECWVASVVEEERFIWVFEQKQAALIEEASQHA